MYYSAILLSRRFFRYRLDFVVSHGLPATLRDPMVLHQPIPQGIALLCGVEPVTYGSDESVRERFRPGLPSLVESYALSPRVKMKAQIRLDQVRASWKTAWSSR